VREIRSLRSTWRGLETGLFQRATAPAPDPTSWFNCKKVPIIGRDSFVEKASRRTYPGLSPKD